MIARRLAAAATLLVCACGGRAAPARSRPANLSPGTDVTVYSAGATSRADALAAGYAVVVERRDVTLAAGRGDLTWPGVPATLDPGSVSMRSWTDPVGTRTLGQSFEGDAPALAWQLDVARAGRHLIEVVYTARRMAWWMDYAAVVDLRGDAPALALRGWASVANDSSLAVAGAQLRLVAGVGGAAWSIDGLVDVQPYATAQYGIVAPARVPAGIEHVFEPLAAASLSGDPTDQYVGIAAGTEVVARLGFDAPTRLPAGAVQVFVHRPGADEPVLAATARLVAAAAGERATIELGAVPHVRGARRQHAFHHDVGARRINEAVVLRVRNDGAAPVAVRVVDRLYRAPKHRVVNAHPAPVVVGDRVEQMLEVPPGQAREASYEAVYFLR